MGKWTLYTHERGVDNLIGVGFLSITENGGDAMFFDSQGGDAKCLAAMRRPRLDWAGALAIRLSGFGLTGKYDKRGFEIAVYIEWTLHYS